MPIRINLLAEAQALEEQRRRDPVKRAIWLGAALASLMVAGSVWIQLKATIVKRELARLESQIGARKADYEQVLLNQKHLADVTEKLTGLNEMATNRLLYGTLLNALQQTIIDDVQLVRMRTDQTYFYTEGVKPKTNADRIIPGRPSTVTEKVLLTLEARDSSANAGDLVNKFKQMVANNSYFQSMQGKTNEVARLTSLSPPNSMDGKPFVQFTLECKFPDKTR